MVGVSETQASHKLLTSGRPKGRDDHVAYRETRLPIEHSAELEPLLAMEVCGWQPVFQHDFSSHCGSKVVSGCRHHGCTRVFIVFKKETGLNERKQLSLFRALLPILIVQKTNSLSLHYMYLTKEESPCSQQHGECETA